MESISNTSKRKLALNDNEFIETKQEKLIQIGTNIHIYCCNMHEDYNINKGREQMGFERKKQDEMNK